MAKNQQSSPICSLKMDINCCKECPVKLEKKLLKSKGVKFVSIEPDKGMVTISGDIDPVKLLEKIKAMGKEAELWFFQKEPHQNTSFFECLKCSSKINDDNNGANSEDDKLDSKQSEDKTDKHFDHHHQHIRKTETKTDMEDFGGFKGFPSLRKNAPRILGNSTFLPAMCSNVQSFSPMFPQPGSRPTWPSYHQSKTGHRLTPDHHYYMPVPPSPPPPLSQPYSYFRSRSPPRVNPMIHYTSYGDNYSNL